MRLALFISLVVAVLAVVFALQNAQPARVNFLKWSFEASLVIVLLITFVAGIATALIASIPRRIRAMRGMSACKKESEETHLK